MPIGISLEVLGTFRVRSVKCFVTSCCGRAPGSPLSNMIRLFECQTYEAGLNYVGIGSGEEWLL